MDTAFWVVSFHGQVGWVGGNTAGQLSNTAKGFRLDISKRGGWLIFAFILQQKASNGNKERGDA